MNKEISRISVEIALSRNFDKCSISVHDEPINLSEETLEEAFKRIGDFLQKTCEDRMDQIATNRTVKK